MTAAVSGSPRPRPDRPVPNLVESVAEFVAEQVEGDAALAVIAAEEERHWSTIAHHIAATDRVIKAAS